MDKGWEAWAAQAAELHTYRADWENRKKEGRGFYKLSEETVATVREDPAKDYRELAEQHSQELAQLLDNFGESQEELLDRLMEIRGIQQHAGPRAEQETIEPTERQPTTTRESAEGETSQIQAQPPISPQMEELVMAVTSDPHEPEPTPQGNQEAPTCKVAEADISTQQPQTDAPAEMVTRKPLAPGLTTGGSMDRNEPKEQEPLTQDDTVTPDSVPSAPQR